MIYRNLKCGNGSNWFQISVGSFDWDIIVVTIKWFFFQILGFHSNYGLNISFYKIKNQILILYAELTNLKTLMKLFVCKPSTIYLISFIFVLANGAAEGK